MANSFPIGNSQTLTFDTLSLTLDSCDFNASGDLAPIGYRRARVQDHWLKVKHLITGVPSISGRRHYAKYEFSWDLQLSAEKAFLAEAIYNEQKIAYSLQSLTPEIRLQDSRLVLLAVALPARERAKVGTVVPPTPAPTNYEYIYPQFDIAMLQFAMEPLILGGAQLWSVKMAGVELTTVPISEDV